MNEVLPKDVAGCKAVSSPWVFWRHLAVIHTTEPTNHRPLNPRSFYARFEACACGDEYVYQWTAFLMPPPLSLDFTALLNSECHLPSDHYAFCNGLNKCIQELQGNAHLRRLPSLRLWWCRRCYFRRMQGSHALQLRFECLRLAIYLMCSSLFQP